MDKLEEIINTPDDSDIGYLAEVDLRCPDNIKEKPKNFPFSPENEVIHKKRNNEHMKKVKPRNYTKAKKSICDWTTKKEFLYHNRVLKFYVRHGMIVDITREINSFKRSEWLEKHISSKKTKRNKAKNDLE